MFDRMPITEPREARVQQGHARRDLLYVLYSNRTKSDRCPVGEIYLAMTRLLTLIALEALLAATPSFAAEVETNPEACPCIANGSWTAAAATVECASQVIYGINFGQDGQYSRRLTIAEPEGRRCASAFLYVGQNGGGYCSAYLESTVVEGVCSLGAAARVDNVTPLGILNCEAALEILRSDVNSLEDCL